MRIGHDFIIRNPEATGHGGELWIDGQKMIGVVDVRAEISMDDVNRVDVRFLAESINKIEPDDPKPIRTIAARPIRPEYPSDNADD
jgi:hypothetical protein